MAKELKTRPTGESVDKFLQGIKNEIAREDCKTLVKVMTQVTRSEPRMWGPGIVGFGEFMWRYPNGREMEWPLAAFAPRKQNLVLYLMPGFDESRDLLKKLGKHKTAKACLYIKTIDDVHMPTLKQLIKKSVDRAKKVAAEKR